MRPARDAQIIQSEGQVVVTTYNLRPFWEKSLFMLGLAPWLGFGIFGLMGISGLISPETLTIGLKVLLIILMILWIGGGVFLQWERFLRAFSRAEIVADQDGVKIVKTFPFGSTKSGYPWDRIEYITHYLETNRPYGGVVMRAGRWLTTIDSCLPNRTAEQVSEALLSVAPSNEKA